MSAVPPSRLSPQDEEAIKARLDSVLEEGYAEIEFENRMMAKAADSSLPHVVGPRVLSLGYAGDPWPGKLAEAGFEVTVVEGARAHYEKGLKDFAGRGITIHYDTFQGFAPAQPFDTVIAGSVIQFFPDPEILLGACRRFLRPGGRLILTTPNPLSIHRRIGALLGMESTPYEVNAAGHASAAVIAYSVHTLRSTLQSSKFNVRLIFGSQLKFLSTGQMKSWDPKLVDALDLLAQEFPAEFCKELIAVCDAP